MRPINDEDLWKWASNRANASQVRMIHGWANSVSSRRAIAIPVWRSSPSAEIPKPPSNDFNGVLALVIDINRFVEVYLGPAMNDLSDSRLVVGLATPEFGVRMGPGREGVAPTPADAHNHVERQGTTILDDAEGRRLHAWAKLDAADETWLVASSARYSLVSGQIRRSAMAQLGLTAMLLVAVPLVGLLIARRERQIQQEQRNLERRLAESQKMEAIGKLAGGVAHDFNNMLTAILGYSSMIQEDAPPKSAIRDQALQIRRAAENAAALTQKLLAFSRKQVLQSDPVDFRSMLGNLLPLVRNAVGEDITVSTQMGEDLWPILADPVQIEQSILNLAINARDAMPKGGTLQIAARNAPRPRGRAPSRRGRETRRLRADHRHRHRHRHGRGDAHAHVRAVLHDQGAGQGHRPRPVDGLRVRPPVRRLHRRDVDARARARRSSCCCRARSAPATPPAPPAADVRRARAPPATVLVAEDEDGVRQLAVETLERRGYRVLVGRERRGGAEDRAAPTTARSTCCSATW